MMHDDVRNIYVTMYDGLNMLDAFDDNMMSMMSMMIAWYLS